MAERMALDDPRREKRLHQLTERKEQAFHRIADQVTTFYPGVISRGDVRRFLSLLAERPEAYTDVKRYIETVKEIDRRFA